MSKPKVNYYPTYQRPPKADKSVVSKISRLFPLTSCLDEALTEIIQEDKTRRDDDSDQSQSSTNQVAIDEKLKERILNKCGEFMSDAFWEESTLQGKGEGQSSYSLSKGASNSASSDTMNGNIASHTEPPAGLLQGKLKYYNRFGTQWRIVVTDAEIRPRVNIDYPKLKRKERTSLVNESQQKVELELRNKRLRRNIHDNEINDGTLESLCQDGIIKLDGDLLLLVYDD